MSVRLLKGDCRAILPTLPAESVHCVVTSPPYWGLRDYGCEGQLGLEVTPEAYVETMVAVFREVRRVLRDDGTLWCNLGDAFQDKQLLGIPWRLAFALQADGWYLRADIIWAKPNPMPESVTDRPTKAHEYVFLLTKSARYFYDADAVRESATPQQRTGDPSYQCPANVALAATGKRHGAAGLNGPSGAHRNLRSVWSIPSSPFPLAHFATFPPALASRCIQAGTSEKGCCRACGAPWAREPLPADVGAWCDHADDLAHGAGGTRGNGRARKAGYLATRDRERVGAWQPSCACDAPPIPSTVLDPFAGSGTVGAVAEQLGRHSLLIELSPTYIQMAEERTAQLGLFTQEAAAP
jgi:DNA modification methylase